MKVSAGVGPVFTHRHMRGDLGFFISTVRLSFELSHGAAGGRNSQERQRMPWDEHQGAAAILFWDGATGQQRDEEGGVEMNLALEQLAQLDFQGKAEKLPGNSSSEAQNQEFSSLCQK